LEKIKKIFLTKLRNKKTNRPEFQEASHTLSHILAHETMSHIETEKIEIETPIEKTYGIKIKPSIILVPILRSGITMVSPFLYYFKNAKVGVVGLKRNEKTAQAHLYYNNIPPAKKDDKIIILDPMIATGGTGIETLKILKNKGVEEKNIIFTSIISSKEGINIILSEFPNIKIITAETDEILNQNKFIVPGLGDFGDRYFGTE